MYAVIKTGGKQYRVEPGDVIDIERPKVSLDHGAEVVFDRVLLVGGDGEAQVGDPLVAGARVDGVCLAEVRGPKVRVFKMKRRKGYRRHRGHRQDLLRVQIGDIHQGGEGDASHGGTPNGDASEEAVTPEAVTDSSDGPEAVTPEAGSPDDITPEAGSPDGDSPEAVEAAAPEAGSPDDITPEAVEAAAPEAGSPDDITPEAGSPDGDSPEADTDGETSDAPAEE